MKKIVLNARKREILEGYVFVLPFILGVLIFFIYPLFASIKLSFGKLVNMQGFKVEWSGIENYMRAFIIDINFVPMFIEVIKQTLTKAPLIIIFSLLLGILLSKNIKLKGHFRVIFFIPFLLGRGDVMRQLLNLEVEKQVISLANGSLIPSELMVYFNSGVISLIDRFMGVIVLVLWSSGVQILLFLSGLQSIPISLYEASKVDGATEWEMFWKITLPMISPIMLLNIIYTIVDSFVDVTNPILTYIQSQAFKSMRFEYAAAMGWVYFAFIIALVLIVMLVLSKYTYIEDRKGGWTNVKKNGWYKFWLWFREKKQSHFE